MKRRSIAEFVAAFLSFPGAVFLVAGVWPMLLILGVGGMTFVVTR